MWAEYLKDKPDLFSKPYPFLSFGSLSQFEIQAGFDDKTWLKKEEKEEADTISQPENQPLLFE
jgi:hypothetical protein